MIIEALKKVFSVQSPYALIDRYQTLDGLDNLSPFEAKEKAKIKGRLERIMGSLEIGEFEPDNVPNPGDWEVSIRELCDMNPTNPLSRLYRKLEATLRKEELIQKYFVPALEKGYVH